MKNLNKIFTITRISTIIVSVAILVFGFKAGWQDGNVNTLLSWTYIMLILALAAVVVVGIVIGAANDAKGLLKMLCLVAVLGVVCFIVYKLAPGSPAQGLLEQPEAGELKLTDTILSLTYITGILAILAIVVGEIRLAITNRKG